MALFNERGTPVQGGHAYVQPEASRMNDTRAFFFKQNTQAWNPDRFMNLRFHTHEVPVYCIGLTVMLFSLRICRMRPHVLSQLAGLGKSIAARLADVRLLPRMHPPVLSQVAGRRERLAACLADIQLLLRVPPHVPSQVAGMGERLAARVADVRPLPQMQPHVPSQVARIEKRLAARLADVRLLPRMQPHVPGQAAGL